MDLAKSIQGTNTYKMSSSEKQQQMVALSKEYENYVSTTIKDFEKKYKKNKVLGTILQFTPMGLSYSAVKEMLNGITTALTGAIEMGAKYVNDVVKQYDFEHRYGDDFFAMVKEFIDDKFYANINPLLDIGTTIGKIGAVAVSKITGGKEEEAIEGAESVQKTIKSGLLGSEEEIAKHTYDFTKEATQAISNASIWSEKNIAPFIANSLSLNTGLVMDETGRTELGNFVDQTVGSMGRMIPAIIGTYLGLPPATASVVSNAYFFASTFGSAFDDALQKGAKLEDAYEYAYGSAFVESATEAIGGVKPGKLLPHTNFSDFLKRTAPFALFSTGVEEGTEEIMSELVQPTLEYGITGEYDTKDMGKRVWDSFMGGFVSGVGFNVAGNVAYKNLTPSGKMKKMSEEYKNLLKEANQDYDAVQKTFSDAIKKTEVSLNTKTKATEGISQAQGFENTYEHNKAMVESDPFASLIYKANDKTQTFEITDLGKEMLKDVSKVMKGSYKGETIDDSKYAVSKIRDSNINIDDSLQEGQELSTLEEIEKIEDSEKKTLVKSLLKQRNVVFVKGGQEGNLSAYERRQGLIMLDYNKMSSNEMQARVTAHEITHKLADTNLKGFLKLAKTVFSPKIQKYMEENKTAKAWALDANGKNIYEQFMENEKENIKWQKYRELYGGDELAVLEEKVAFAIEQIFMNEEVAQDLFDIDPETASKIFTNEDLVNTFKKQDNFLFKDNKAFNKVRKMYVKYAKKALKFNKAIDNIIQDHKKMLAGLEQNARILTEKEAKLGKEIVKASIEATEKARDFKLEKDIASNGDILTPEQQKMFEYTKAVTENGELKALNALSDNIRLRTMDTEDVLGNKVSKDVLKYNSKSKATAPIGVLNGELIEALVNTFHGSDADFTQFDLQYNDWGLPGFYLTDSEIMAGSYLRTKGGKVKSYYLNIEKPLVIDAQDNNWNQIPFSFEIKDNVVIGEILKNYLYGGNEYLALEKSIDAQDSIIYDNFMSKIRSDSEIMNKIDEYADVYTVNRIMGDIQDDLKYSFGIEDESFLLSLEYLEMYNKVANTYDKGGFAGVEDFNFEEEVLSAFIMFGAGDVKNIKDLLEKIYDLSSIDVFLQDKTLEERKKVVETVNFYFRKYGNKKIDVNSFSRGVKQNMIDILTSDYHKMYNTESYFKEYVENIFGEKMANKVLKMFENFNSELLENEDYFENDIYISASSQELLNILEYLYSTYPEDLKEPLNYFNSKIKDGFSLSGILKNLIREQSNLPDLSVIRLTYGNILKYMINGRLEVKDKESLPDDIKKYYSPAQTLNGYFTTRDIANYAWWNKDKYDGVIIQNTTDYGGKVKKEDWLPHTVYIAFYPEQIKSTENKHPTKNPDTMLRADFDSSGKPLTLGQHTYFIESKAVDENGNLLILYHGTDADFEKFEHQKYDSSSGFYFTLSKKVAKSYTRLRKSPIAVYLNIKKPYVVNAKNREWSDLNHKIKRKNKKIGLYDLALDVYDIFDLTAYSDIIRAREFDLYKYLSESKPKNVEEFLNIIYKKSGGVSLETLEELYEKYSKYSEENGEILSDFLLEKGLFTASAFMYKAPHKDYFGGSKEDIYLDVIDDIKSTIEDIKEIKEKYKNVDFSKDVLPDSDIFDNRYDFIDYVREQAEDELILESTDDVVDYARRHGYDGVIIKNVKDFNVNNDTEEVSDDYIVFSPEQIKSINNENPTTDERFRYRLADETGEYAYINQATKQDITTPFGNPYIKGLSSAKSLARNVINSEIYKESEGKRVKLGLERGTEKQAYIDYTIEQQNIYNDNNEKLKKMKNKEQKDFIKKIMADRKKVSDSRDRNSEIFNHFDSIVKQVIANIFSEGEYNSERKEKMLNEVENAIVFTQNYLDTVFVNNETSFSEENPKGYQFNTQFNRALRYLAKVETEQGFKDAINLKEISPLFDLLDALVKVDFSDKNTLDMLTGALKQFTRYTSMKQINSMGSAPHTIDKVLTEHKNKVGVIQDIIGKNEQLPNGKVKRKGGVINVGNLFKGVTPYFLDMYAMGEITGLFMKDTFGDIVVKRIEDAQSKLLEVTNLSDAFWNENDYITNNRDNINNLEKDYIEIKNLLTNGNPTNLSKSQVLSLFNEMVREVVRNGLVEQKRKNGEKTNHFDTGSLVSIQKNTKKNLKKKNLAVEAKIVDRDKLLEELLNIIKKDKFMNEYNEKVKQYLNILYNFENIRNKDIKGLELVNDNYYIHKVIDGIEQNNLKLYMGNNSDFDYEISNLYFPLSSKKKNNSEGNGAFSVNTVIDLGINDGMVIGIKDNQYKGVVNSITDVLLSFTRQVANYYGLFRLNNDLNILFNKEYYVVDNGLTIVKEKTEDGKPYYTDINGEVIEKPEVDLYSIPSSQFTTLKDEFDKIDTRIVKYFEKLLRDMAGYSAETDSLSEQANEWIGVLRKNFFKASLGLNPKVILTQFASFINIAIMFGGDKVDTGTLMAKMVSNSLSIKDLHQKAKYLIDNSEIFKNRRKNATYDMSEALNDSVFNTNKLDEVTEKFMTGISATDTMINEAFFVSLVESGYTNEEALKITEEAITRYQSGGLAIHKSELLRTQNELVKVFTKFLGEPMKMLSNIYTALLRNNIVGKLKNSKEQIIKLIDARAKNIRASATSVAKTVKTLNNKKKKVENVIKTTKEEYDKRISTIKKEKILINEKYVKSLNIEKNVKNVVLKNKLKEEDYSKYVVQGKEEESFFKLNDFKTYEDVQKWNTIAEKILIKLEEVYKKYGKEKATTEKIKKILSEKVKNIDGKYLTLFEVINKNFATLDQIMEGEGHEGSNNSYSQMPHNLEKVLIDVEWINKNKNIKVKEIIKEIFAPEMGEIEKTMSLYKDIEEKIKKQIAIQKKKIGFSKEEFETQFKEKEEEYQKILKEKEEKIYNLKKEIKKINKEIYKNKTMMENLSEEAKNAYISGKETKKEVERITSEEEIERNKKQAQRLIASFASSYSWTVLIGLAFDILRHGLKDDDDDTNGEAFSKKLLENMVDELVGYIPFGRDLYQALVKGYDFNKISDFSAFNTLLSSTHSLLVDMLNGGDFNALKHLRQISISLGQTLGIPTREIERMITIPVSFFAKDIDYKYRKSTGQRTASNKELKHALEKGDNALVEEIIEGKIEDNNLPISARIKDEVVDITKKGGKVNITRIPETIKIKGKEYENKGNTFKNVYSTANRVVERIMSSSQYRKLNTENKAKVINSIFNYYYVLAKQKVSRQKLLADDKNFTVKEAIEYFNGRVAYYEKAQSKQEEQKKKGD